MHDSATDPDTRTETAVEDLLRCVAAGDIPELVALFAPDAVWEVPGDAEHLPWLGRRTREEIPGFFSAMAELTIHTGEDAVLIGHARVIYTPTGAPIDTPFAIHLTVAEDGIKSFYMFEDSWSAALAARPATSATRPE